MIKFLDIQKITAAYQDEISQALFQTAESGWYIHGKALKNFEQRYAQFIGTKHCVGCGNGLDALSLILRGAIELGLLKKGDEILVSANTFIATILAITENGLHPIFIDAKGSDGQLDESLLEGAYTPKTRALMLVHLYGQCAYNEKIGEFCKQHNLLLIEDNAQAHGCYFNQQRTGSLGYAAAHSFYPGKNLGALGDGGAVTTNNEELAQTIRALGNYGQSEKYICTHCGKNSRLDEMQAAVLNVKLKYLDKSNQARREIADFYYKNICNPLINLPQRQQQEGGHVYHLFPIRCKHRDLLKQYLWESQIETGIHYPIPPHKQQCYPNFSHLQLPVTEQIHNEELSLPISPVMTIAEAEKVVAALNSFAIPE